MAKNYRVNERGERFIFTPGQGGSFTSMDQSRTLDTLIPPMKNEAKVIVDPTLMENLKDKTKRRGIAKSLMQQ